MVKPLDQCGSPIQLPLQNVTLKAGAARRGVPLSVDGQAFAFQPRAASSNIYAQNANGRSAAGCIGKNRGTLDEGSCSNWHPATDRSASGAAAELSPSYTYASASWGSDTITVNSSLSIPNVPIGVGALQGDLGLDQNSTFLRALKNGG